MITKKRAEAVETVPVEPVALVTLAELAAEGFGPWSGQFTRGPRDVIRALAKQLDGEIVLDDLGRQCVSRDVAARLIAERAEAERRQAEERERHWAEQSERHRPVSRGVPVPEGMEDLDALSVLKAAEAGTERGELTVHRMPDPDTPVEAGEFYRLEPPGKV